MSNLSIVFIVFFSSIVLLCFKRFRPDLIALLALLALTVTGVVTTEEAWSGFGNPAVSTIWIMFVIAAGLQHTGVAGMLCDYLLKIKVLQERGYIVLVILISAGISAFMNNAPCAALLLPIFLELGRRKGISATKLLMPMSFAIVIGGTITLVGTPANLIAADIARSRGLEKIEFFDMSPFGLGMLLVALFYLVPIFLRKKIRSEQPSGSDLRTARDLINQYNLTRNSRWYKIPYNSPLVGTTLGASMLRQATELNVLAIQRFGHVTILPHPDDYLEANDLILIYGDFGNLEFISSWQDLKIEELNDRNPLTSQLPIVMKALVFPGSELVDKPISQTGLSSSFNTRIVSIIRNNHTIQDFSVSTRLEVRDELLLILSPNRLQYLIESGLLSEFTQIDWNKIGHAYETGERLYVVSIKARTTPGERALNVVSLKAAFDINVLAIQRGSDSIIDIKPQSVIEAGDQVLILASPESISALLGIQKLEPQTNLDPAATLEAALGNRFELVEFTISPRSSMSGQSFKELRFSETFGATVLAIWRQGQTKYHGFADYRLQFGDALLMISRTSDVRALRENTELVPLSQFSGSLEYKGSATRAILISIATLIMMFTEVLDIPTTALLAATAMVIFRCITMEQAYKSIDWKSVLLMAGFWPLGIAMAHSGADQIFANWLIGHSVEFGALGVITILYFATNLATAVIPHSTLVVLIAPIAIRCAEILAISHKAAIFAVAIAASACFWSPIAHPVNLMIMSPGKYTFKDFLKMGLPLTLLCGITCIAMIYFIYL
jgi:di/tricarboxylate transporter